MAHPFFTSLQFQQQFEIRNEKKNGRKTFSTLFHHFGGDLDGLRSMWSNVSKLFHFFSGQRISRSGRKIVNNLRNYCNETEITIEL